MRPIKFRGKAYRRWIYGGLVYSDNIEPAIYFEVGNKVYKRIEWAYVDPATVGQFTGLTDRNGEEIYEGDILAIEGIKYPRHYIVSWNTEKLMFCIGDTPLYALLEAGSTTMREYIVCGNVHDNHELLEEGGDK